MKNISLKFLTSASILSLLIGGAGCAKIDDFGDTNIDPNGATSPITSALLTNFQSNLGNMVYGTRQAIYCQYISETQYTDVSLYSLAQIEMGTTYSGNAANTISSAMDMQVIINQNSNPATQANAAQYGSNANQIAIAKIMKAYILWSATDRWGDIPYSEALKGAAILSPKYDTQEEVYTQILQDLEDGVNGFDAGPVMQGDVAYSGNVDKWKKFGNTLRMLVSLRMSKVYPNPGQFAATEFAAAANHPAGVITSNADNFVLRYPGGGFNNPWWNAYDGRTDFAESKTIYDCLTGLGDTRQSVYGSNNTAFPYGLTRDLAVAFTTDNPNYAKVLADSKRAQNSPVVVVSATISLLARAEGVERGWISGDAKADYNAGITASFAEWGVTMPANYLTTSPANYDDGAGVAAIGQAPAPYDVIPSDQDALTPNRLSRIALQRWLGAYPNGFEGWAEWRRTGVPDLKPTTLATNPGGQIPRRYMYGVVDRNLNPEQVAIASARLSGGDTQDSRIWWDRP